MREQAEAEAIRQRQRLVKLGEERERLLHAYYAGAIQVDLLRQEQDRLTTESNQADRQLEITEASVADVENVLGKALDLLTDCQRAYLAAPAYLRRQWNQALFERLVVYDDRIGKAEVAEPFATLADRHLPELLGGKAPAQGAVSSDGGWNETALAGELGRGAGLVPGAPSRTRPRGPDRSAGPGAPGS